MLGFEVELEMKLIEYRHVIIKCKDLGIIKILKEDVNDVNDSEWSFSLIFVHMFICFRLYRQHPSVG